MARYRQIHTTFWTDAFVEDMTPEQKLFYIYLLTNSRTTQCGIYEITKRTISNETGYPIDTVSILLNDLVDSGKIKHNERNKEVFVLNWLKYNWIDSIKVRQCMYKELEKVKTKEFLEEFDTLLIPYTYRIHTLLLNKKERMDTVSIDYREERKEKERKRKEEEKESKTFSAKNTQKIEEEIPW
jgi:hypothetical protein